MMEDKIKGEKSDLGPIEELELRSRCGDGSGTGRKQE
jgi:hypothetical protein